MTNRLTKTFSSATRATFLTLALLLPTAPAARAAISATDKAPNACALLTDAEASAILGKPAKSKLDPKPTPANHVLCTWQADSANITISLETDAVLLEYRDHQTVEPRFKMMLDEIKAKRASDVAGLGAPAVWTEFHQLWISKPGRMITISMSRKSKVMQSDDLPGVKAVAAKAVPRL